LASKTGWPDIGGSIIEAGAFSINYFGNQFWISECREARQENWPQFTNFRLFLPRCE